ncbi:SGNH/GDSL hydrolase family protein [Azospirillum sp.]|uniref:SGNH/GDSL hydrolase family protein n=1 Tax=Azospirillum sp. TaxID=34012 RepID=UPI003D72DBFD
MKPAAALLPAILLAATGALAQQPADDPCAVPESVLTVDAHLTRAQSWLKKAGTLPILVVNTAKANPARGEASYPAQLEKELAARLPGRRVTVAVRNLPGATAHEMLPAMDAAVKEQHPALVVWQVGTMDAMRNVGPDGFGAALASGIAQTHARGSDIVIMDMQYSPQTSQLITFQPYVDYVEWVTQNNDVFHFPRYEMMRYWIEEGRVTVGSESKEENLKAFTFVHGCVGRLLAQTISAMLDRTAENGQ